MMVYTSPLLRACHPLPRSSILRACDEHDAEAGEHPKGVHDNGPAGEHPIGDKHSVVIYIAEQQGLDPFGHVAGYAGQDTVAFAASDTYIT